MPKKNKIPDISRRNTGNIHRKPVETSAFQKIRDRLRRAVSGALSRQSHHEDKAEDLQLFDRAATDPSSAKRKIHGLFEHKPLALIGFDTPGIQDYLFRVQRPVDLYGGSWLVNAFTDPDPGEPLEYPLTVSIFQHFRGVVAIPSHSAIYAGGGGGLLLVAAFESQGVADRLRQILAEKTGGQLRTIASILPIWPEDLADSPASFSSTEAILKADASGIRKKKLRPSAYAATMAALKELQTRDRSEFSSCPSTISVEHYIDRCRACGAAVGQDRRNRSPQDYEPVCQSCELRRALGARLKSELAEAQHFGLMVEDLDEDDIAVLYADGANVGKAFQQVRTPAQHHALSRAVDRAMEAAQSAVIEKLKQCFPKDESKESPKSRHQIFLCGGDDLVMVMPASAVFNVISPLIQTFEESFCFESNDVLRGAYGSETPIFRKEIEAFGLGIGIAVTEKTFPIQFAMEYAKELLKSAKNKIHKSKDLRSAIDFMVLRSGTPLADSVRAWRKDHLHRETPSATLDLTCKPYSLAEFEDLLERALLLRRFVSSSQLHLIRREIDRGLHLSRSLWRYQHARAKAGQGWAAYRQGCQVELEDVDRLLWNELGKSKWKTDFLDILELFELVRPVPNRRTE